MKPKASYYDVVLNCKDLVAISVIAKDYGWSANRMNQYLHEKEYSTNRAIKYGYCIRSMPRWVIPIPRHTVIPVVMARCTQPFILIGHKQAAFSFMGC